NNSRGFTLIELLVTIGIISILASIGLVIYTSVMKQGRDSKRQSDLRSIQSAVEQYYADNFSYPAQVSSGGSITFNGKTYMNTVPSDPITGNSPYVYVPSGSSYCIYASLENPPSPVPAPPTGCTYPSNKYNFALTSP
ncbi:MAG: type II secretion system GspH family protein, partial [Candidatus Daviesbacteria bacterium]|nr:type II secretion system GspH family protein [Candidatus Daviesbacteria bacterium]